MRERTGGAGRSRVTVGMFSKSWNDGGVLRPMSFDYLTYDDVLHKTSGSGVSVMRNDIRELDHPSYHLVAPANITIPRSWEGWLQN